MSEVRIAPSGADYSAHRDQYDALEQDLRDAGFDVGTYPREEHRGGAALEVYAVIVHLVEAGATVTGAVQVAGFVRDQLRGRRLGGQRRETVPIYSARGEILQSVELDTEED